MSAEAYTPEFVRAVLVKIGKESIPDSEVDRILALASCRRDAALTDTIARWISNV